MFCFFIYGIFPTIEREVYLHLLFFKGEELLEPTKIYVKGVIPVLRTNLVKAFAHITGGGLTENIPRILPKDMGAVLDAKTWIIQPIFAWLATVGKKTQILFKF